MILVVAIVIALMVVAIALVAVGRVTTELSQAPPRSYFVVDEAVQYVADGLADETTAVLSYDDVRHVIEWYLEYLEGRGVAAEVEPEDVAGPVVADEDEALAAVLGKADDAGVEVTDEQVVEILAGVEDYLVAIGAIGEEVPPPVDPTAEQAT